MMINFFVRALLVITLLMSTSACSYILKSTTSETVNYAYLGNIEFSKPIKKGKAVIVPLSLSEGKWGQDSALSFGGFNVEVKNSTIYLTAKKCLCNRIYPVQFKIENPKFKEYEAYYRNPDSSLVSLGKIQM